MITRDKVEDASAEIIQAIAAIAARHGLNVKRQKNVTFYDEKFSIRYDFTDSTVDVKKVNFEKVCYIFGFKASHYGETFFDADGETCTITGLNTRAKKYPVNFTRGGVGRKAGAEYVKGFLRDQGKL